MFSLPKISSLFKPRKVRQMTEKTNANAESGESKIVYVQDFFPDRASKLYTLNLQTGQADLVGEIAEGVSDVAFVGSQLYGLRLSNDDTELVEIDRVTGEASSVGNIGFGVVGLAYSYQRETLYAVATKQIIAIDLETGRGTPAMSFTQDKRNCCEIAFDGSGQAYITLIGSNKEKHLASCDIDNGRAKVIGNIGFPDLGSMEFVDNILYGVTGNFFDLGEDGRLLRIDTKTGKGAVITKTTPASRWAGMTVGTPVPANDVEETIDNNSDQLPASSSDEITETEPEPSFAGGVPLSEEETTSNSDLETSIKERTRMPQLTIDTKANCYVIDPEGMSSLQDTVASKATLEQGSYEIQITSGRYSYSNNAEEGEPEVLLWIYGTDGSTFVNQETGVETGATWSSLNGYNQKLRLEVKQQTVINALFFKVGNEAGSGSIELTITSDSSDSEPQKLTVDSQNNSYSLDEQSLSSLKQWDNNFIELEPGNYRLKIQSANGSYWSQERRFNLEPWALIWLSKGSFIPKFAETEISETWCSLNGLEDEIILEVKNKTTLSGFFFDTHKEDNEGQIVVSIEPLSEEAFDRARTDNQSKIESDRPASISQNTETSYSRTTQTSSDTSDFREPVTVGSGSSSFNFRFDRDRMESTWREMAGKIRDSVTVIDEQDPKKEAQYWDTLEKWILKGYQTQAKELAMQVARLEFMMSSITQQMESSFNQNFQAWSTHFDERLNNLISTRITTMVDERVNRKLTPQIQEIEKRVEDKILGEVEQRIDTIVNLKVANLSQDIKNTTLEQIRGDLDGLVGDTVNINIDRRSAEINDAVTGRILADIDERVNNLINVKITEQGQESKRDAIAEIQGDLDNKIDAVVNVKLTDLSTELGDRITQEVQSDFDGRIDNVVNLKVNNLAQEIKDSSLDLIASDIESIKADLDRQITEKTNIAIDNRSNDISNQVIEQIETDIDNRVSNVVNVNIDDRSSEIKKQTIEEIKRDLDRRIDAVVNLKVTNITPQIKNTITSGMQNNVDKRIDAVVNLKTNALRQNIKNLVIQQIQPDINLQIMSAVGKSTENIVKSVENKIAGDIDDRIQVNFDNKILNFRDDVTNLVRNEINSNNDTITNIIIGDITNQEFFPDVESIKTEVNNFFDRIGQFETKLNSRIDRGDTQLYNWTLEQLTALQGCLSDRQTLSNMFETFAANLREELDNADCVQPTRFTSRVTIEQNAISTTEAPQLPGNS